ncbi:MAG: DUF5110 domain-containing protein [Thermotogae bacterium]|nr:DUF5110 domain-containing protein [Thermotogota bacterium]
MNMQRFGWIDDRILMLVYGKPDVNKFTFQPKVKNDFPHLEKCEIVVNDDLVTVERKGKMVIEDVGLKNEDGFFMLERKLPNGVVYGLGDKIGPLNRREKRFRFFNRDCLLHTEGEDLYKTLPFFIFLNDEIVYGSFFDYPGYMEIDLDTKGNERYTVRIRGNGFVNYIFFGESMREVVKNYLKLTGSNFLPPIWAFGYQQSRFGYSSQDEIIDIAKKFRDKNIPCDVLHLDIDYMDSYKIFTWNGENFPNPKKMVDELHEMGFKVVTIVDPGVKVESGYEVYEEGIKGDHFVLDGNGKPFIGVVWPGRTHHPDFLRENTRRWWGDLHEEFVKLGIDGFWNDMNEPSIFTSERVLNEMKSRVNSLDLDFGVMIPSLFENGVEDLRNVYDEIFHRDDEGEMIPHHKVRNIYGFMMTKATYEGLRRLDPRKRYLIFSRSAYPGIQRYGGVWTGDNRSWWYHVNREIVRNLTLSLCGIFYTGFDVGGFKEDVTPEMLVRFYQVGAFMPLFRNHSCVDSRSQEPWAFGEKLEKMVRKIIELRYSLIPYIYSNYALSVMNDEPFIRPLVYDFEKDSKTWNLEDQFMFGPSIMVAPVTSMGIRERLVYFPEDVWLDLVDLKMYSKGWNVVPAPLEKIPHFQRLNSAVMKTKPMNYLLERKMDVVEFEIFMKKSFSFFYYEDDGVSNDWEKGNYSLRKVEIDENKIRISKIDGNYQSKSTWIFKIRDVNGRYRERIVELRKDELILSIE